MRFNLEFEVANQKALYLERAGIWDSQALTIPLFLLKPEPEYSEAERLIGREICQETRKYDLREMIRAANPRLEK